MEPTRYLVAGELSLDGEVRGIPGGLPLASRARDQGLAGVLLPVDSAREARVVEGIQIFGCRRLADVVGHLSGERPLPPLEPPGPEAYRGNDELDLGDVRGQDEARFALEVAAAGGHNLLPVRLKGPTQLC